MTDNKTGIKKGITFCFWLAFGGGFFEFLIAVLNPIIFENRTPTLDEMNQGIILMAFLWSLIGVLSFLLLTEKKFNKTTLQDSGDVK